MTKNVWLIVVQRILFIFFHFDIFSGENSATSRSCIAGVVETLRTFRLTREQHVAVRARK